PAWKTKLGKHSSPLCEALKPERGVEQHAARGEQLLKTLQACNGIGKPMQRHARDDEVEARMPASLSAIHHLIADVSGLGWREVAAAFGDHRRGEHRGGAKPLRVD